MRHWLDLATGQNTGWYPVEYALLIKTVRRIAMSVEIETSALSMFESLDSLKLTPLVMHRIQIELRDIAAWYAVIRELNQVFGANNWKGQSHVKRRLENLIWDDSKTIWVWFDVPDQKIATWLAVKLAVQVKLVPNK